MSPPAGSVQVLDVGHGNCALALGDGWTVMVDAAPSQAVLRTLDQLDLERIDVMVISHRDHDHARGVEPLLSRENLEIGTIYISADANKNPSAPETALLLAALADAKRSGRCKVSRDLDAALPQGELDGGGMQFDVLAPTFATGMTGPKGPSPTGGTMSSNTVSAVVRVTLPDGTRILLPGDIDHIALRELLDGDKPADLSADVLVFPHHGALSTVRDERRFAHDVVRAVAPHTVLFSVARGARVRPSEDIVRGVFDANPQAYIACTQLSTGCLLDNDALPSDQGVLTHLTDIPSAGRARCRSCAGSITLGHQGIEGPAPPEHQTYLLATADRPMCNALRP